jgi:hypothetical protein
VSLDPGAIFLSLLTSGIGFVLFVYGKKQDRWPQLIAGLALMVYPYFVGSAVLSLLIAITICAGLWVVVKAGY